MSHISTIEIEVRDLPSLKAACRRLGLQFMENKTSFKWYGYEDGHCDHVIQVPGATYEIGVVKAGNGFELNCDFYDSKLEAYLGTNGGLLKQAYGVERTKLEARRKGYSVIEQQTETGIRLRVRLAA